MWKRPGLDLLVFGMNSEGALDLHLFLPRQCCRCGPVTRFWWSTQKRYQPDPTWSSCCRDSDWPPFRVRLESHDGTGGFGLSDALPSFLRPESTSAPSYSKLVLAVLVLGPGC